VPCSVCVPVDGTVIVILAVDGAPGATIAVPSDVPSSVKSMVPDGGVAPTAGAEIVAAMVIVPPANGVVVDGVMATVGKLFATVIAAACDVAFV